MQGRIPPWIFRFIKCTGKGINRFQMIKNNDKVLLGVSGGKDSLALALALSLRRKWLPINYSLHAVMIEWTEFPMSIESRSLFNRFFEELGIELTIHTTSMFPSSFNDKFNCYLCARNRRRILFTFAGEKNIGKIALGHHLDDIAETTLINLFFRGIFDTMRPVQPFFDGDIIMIRPLCFVEERVITRLSETLSFPVYRPECPYHGKDLRSIIKPVITSMSRLDRHVRRHIFDAFFKYSHMDIQTEKYNDP